MKNLVVFYFVFLCFSLTITAQVNLDSALVAFYPFNGNANDESGNGNNGIVTGAILTTDRYDNPDAAFLFNGETDVITIPYSNSLNITEALSIAAWINVEYKSLPYLGRIVIKNPLPNNPIVFGMFHGHTNFISVQLAESPYTIIYLDTEDNIIENLNWEFVAFTWDGENLKIYVNGNLIIWAQADDFVGMTSLVSEITIGNSKNPSIINGIKGKIDDVRIYDRALNDSEILALATSDSTNEVVETNSTLISVFPNPANKLLNVIGLTYDSKVMIYNLSGQMITKSVYFGNPIDISGLVSGTYLIELYTEKKLMYSKKFVKI
ncbi:MAG TPA: T9SS type A sorting domain-containing protein [Bacteroidales bacterium]|jgi:hypothetical protein|nr:T9SS type A sorting domain-containing protein [Bacteroidales bacterium]